MVESMECAETLVGVHVFNERKFKTGFNEHTQSWSYHTEIACVCGERPEDLRAERKRIFEVERQAKGWKEDAKKLSGVKRMTGRADRLPGFE